MSLRGINKTVYGSIVFTMTMALLMEFAYAISSHTALPRIADGVELVLSMLIAIVLLIQVRRSFLRYVTLGFALAIGSWTLGELYTLSYRHINEVNVAYPSVADFAFCGFFLLVSSSLGIMKRVDIDDVNKGATPYLIFLVMGLPVLILFTVQNTLMKNIMNFVYVFLSASIMYEALTLIKLKLYPMIIVSVFFIGLTNLFFLVLVNYSTNVHFATLLYPIGFSLLLLGVIKNNRGFEF
jgi:hypothetical protein